jgi:Fe2+ transport system protein B
MAEESTDEQLLHRLYEQISQHIETRWEYFSLTSTEKISGIVSNLAGGFVVLVFSLLVLFFFTFGFAWWLGDFINNRAGGFALTGLIFVPIALVVSRWVRPYVRTKVIQSILHDESAEKPANHG